MIYGQDASIRQIMKSNYSASENADLYDLSFHAKLLLKLQKGQQGVPSTLTASTKNQNEGPKWQTQGITVNVIFLTHTETNSFKKNLWVWAKNKCHRSSVSTNLFVAIQPLFLYIQYKSIDSPAWLMLSVMVRDSVQPNCPLISSKQSNLLPYLRKGHLCSPQPCKDETHGTHPPARPEAWSDNSNSRRKHSSF